MFGYSPIIPLQINKQDGIALTKTYEEVAKQNLLMLIMTSPGERIMFPDFGAGLKLLLFEQNNTGVSADIHASITNQVKMYLPYIIINDIIINDNPAATGMDIFESHYTFLVKVHYTIDFIGIQDIVEIEI
jgi:phage baseplate assembly protein W